jgi:hypothetical protein
VQPYIALAHRYLFHEKWLVYQLLAAGRHAVVVFPVQPFGDWGPFAQVAGLSRLICEITHLLHRTGLDNGGASTRAQDVALSPRSRFGVDRIHQPPMRVRRVVLSGFSAGMSPVVGMLGTQIGARLQSSRSGMTHELFGADVAPFLNVWKEVWDFDAPAAIRNAMDTALPGWLKQQQDRMARCYQSDHTGSQGWLGRTPLQAFATAFQPPQVSASGHIAQERHTDIRCSLVYFGAGYLHHSSSDAPLPPSFWTDKDDHQAVPRVAFGHAARLSGLSRG